jgi:hypothetical protein
MINKLREKLIDKVSSSFDRGGIQGVWILLAGIWNDRGYWHDTAEWID